MTLTAIAGTQQMVRLALRRDRLMIPLWLLGAMGTVAATVAAFRNLYPDVAGRQAFGASIQTNATFRALVGVIYDDTTIGGLTAWRVTTIVVTLLAVMSIFVVTRHTRQEEETGRLELLGSTVLGRRSPLVAGLLVAAAANLLAAVLTAAILIAGGDEAAGSVALGLALGLGGFVFAGVAAVTAQLTETARAANGIACTVLAASYLLRAVGDSAGDTGPTWLSWLSPIGWAEEVRPFAGNRWALLGLLLVVAVLLAGAAAVLNQHRDFGAGMFASRPGPAIGRPSFGSVWALGARLQRWTLIAWLGGFALFGLVYGGVSGGISDLLQSSAQMQQILQQMGGAGVITDTFFAAVVGIFALVAAAYSISAMLRLRGEETAGRLESVLATPAPRHAAFGSNLVFALLGPVLLMLVAAALAGITGNVVLDDEQNHVPGLVGGALAQVPAIWVLTGITAALIGIRPQWSAAAWAFLAGFLLLGQLGPVLQLPQWVMDVSPFTHVPKLPGAASVPALPLVALTLVAAALIVVGVAAFRRRDIG